MLAGCLLDEGGSGTHGLRYWRIPGHEDAVCVQAKGDIEGVINIPLNIYRVESTLSKIENPIV